MKKRSAIILGVTCMLSAGILFATFNDVGRGVARQIGSVVGMYASVGPNDYNTLAQQLDERARELDSKETTLELQRQQLEEEAKGKGDVAMIYVTAIGSLLLALVLLNFYLDWRRNGAA